MMLRALSMFTIILVFPAILSAQSVAANHVIRSKTILRRDDLVLLQPTIRGAFRRKEQVAGKEARTILYPGRAILSTDIGPPSVVRRNQIVSLVYQSGSLSISVEGRALGQGGIGERIRAMNVSSRATVIGIVSGPGKIRIIQ